MGGLLSWEEATVGCRLHLTPAPHYLCLNMPRLSCVNLWVRYLSCSAKHLACVAANLPVCPSPPTPLGSLLPGAGRSVLLCWDAFGIASPHPLCCAWVRQVGPESHPFPRSSFGGVWQGVGGASVGCARAHARLSTRPCARPAPPAQRSERLSLPLSAPRGRCLLQAWGSVRWAACPEAGRRVRGGCLGP